MATVALSGIITPTNVVTATSTTTLTNKTISGASNTLSNIPLSTGVTGTLPIANGGTNSTATPTAGTVPYGTGTAFAFSAAGSSGQFLQSNGSSAPTWATVGSSALIFLSTVTASNSATVDIETTFNSTYTNYLLVVADVSLVTGGGTLQALLKINGTYQTGSYRSFLISGDSSATTITGTNQDLPASTPANVFISLGQGNRNGGFTMLIQAPSDTANYKPISFNGSFNNNSGQITTVIGSIMNLSGTQAMTGIRFQASSGNIDTGTFRLYGIANS
jgi:hypothetical protein